MSSPIRVIFPGNETVEESGEKYGEEKDHESGKAVDNQRNDLLS